MDLLAVGSQDTSKCARIAPSAIQPAGAAATETVMLDVSGMKCGGCSASVKRILLSNEGVQHAAVNLLTETAVVKLRPAEGSAEKAAELLTTKVVPPPILSHRALHTT